MNPLLCPSPRGGGGGGGLFIASIFEEGLTERGFAYLRGPAYSIYRNKALDSLFKQPEDGISSP